MSRKIITSKKTITVIVISCILTIIFILARLNSQHKTEPINNALEKITAISPQDAKKSVEIVTVNKLYEIGEGDPIITAVITDVKKLAERHSFLSRAYKNDLIISTPKKTVVYDPSTSTIRDISTVVIYKELQEMLQLK